MDFLLAKATVLLLVALGLRWLLRRSSAAWRASVSVCALLGLLVLPVLQVVTPPVIAVPVSIPVSEPVSRLVTRTAPTPSRAQAVSTLPFVSPMALATAPLAPLPPPPTRFPWERLGLGVLLLGCVFALGRLVVGLLGLRRLVAASEPAPEGVQAEVATLAQSLQLPRVPEVRVAGEALSLVSPLTFGWWRGVVLLPSTSLYDPSALKVALLHELIHLRRHDWLVLLLARVTVALWWFHPLVYLLVRPLRADLEAACDDRVLRSGVAAPDYAGYLVSFARLAAGGRS